MANSWYPGHASCNVNIGFHLVVVPINALKMRGFVFHDFDDRCYRGQVLHKPLLSSSLEDNQWGSYIEGITYHVLWFSNRQLFYPLLF